jgi:CubicO group peptidase (beta-lactamase class C family)
MGAGSTAHDELKRYLDGAAALGGVVSAAEAIVATPEEILFRHAAGFRVGGEPLRTAAGARFDAASLTKLWAATLALALDSEDGRHFGERQRQRQKPRLRLGERLEVGDADASLGAGSGLAVGGAEEDAVTLEDLLRHRAGFPAWTFLPLRLGRRLGDRAELVGFLLGLRNRAATPEVVYSDLDFLLWGLLVEERVGRPWRELLDQLVCAPLGIGAIGTTTRANDPATAVECRLDNGREVELAKVQGLPLSLSRSFLLGVPQDGNARALLGATAGGGEGVEGIEAAHAGLFVTADELLALAREWLRPEKLLAPAAVAGALAGCEQGGYGLGWQGWTETSSAAELPRASFGHTGFTGGSVWIDPEGERIYLLLAHRLASSIDFAPFRREFHRLAAAL